MGNYETTQDRERVQYHVPLTKDAVPPPGEGHGHYHDSDLGGPCAVTPSGYHPYAKGVSFAPSGSGDNARFNAMLAAQQSIASGAPILFDAGNYAIEMVGNDGIDLKGKHGVVLQLHPNTTVTAAHCSQAFTCWPTTRTPISDTITTSANVTRDSDQVQVSAAVAAGAEIALLRSTDTACRQNFTVKTCTGSSAPYTLTLDRPIRFPFASGSKVYVFAAGNAPQNIRILGNGATFHSEEAHDRLFSFGDVRHAEISDLYIYGDVAKYPEGVYYDGSCHDVKMNRIWVNGGGIETEGDTVTCTDCHVRNSDTTGAGENGFNIWDVLGGRYAGISCDQSVLGIQLNNNGGFGCRDVQVSRYLSTRATTAGVWVAASENVAFRDGRVGNCTLTGVSVESTSSHVVFDGLYLENIGGTGVSSAGTNVIFRNVVAKNAGTSNVGGTFAGDVTIDGWANLNSGSSTANILGFGAACTAKVSRYTGYGRFTVSKELTISDSTVTSQPSSYMFHVDSPAILKIENSTLTNAGAAPNCIHPIAGSTIRIGRNVKFSGYATPIEAVSGAYYNRGTGTLTGTTPVSIAFPDLQAHEVVCVTRTAASGDDTGFIVVVQTAGVGFTVASTNASDTGTFSYVIL